MMGNINGRYDRTSDHISRDGVGLYSITLSFRLDGCPDSDLVKRK